MCGCLSFIFHIVNLAAVLKANFLEWMSPDDFDCQSVYACTSDASSARWCKQVSNKICVGGSVDLKVTMMLTMSMTMMMMMTALIMIVAFHLVMMVPPVSSFLSSPFPPSRPPAGSQNSEEPQMVFILKHSKLFYQSWPFDRRGLYLFSHSSSLWFEIFLSALSPGVLSNLNQMIFIFGPYSFIFCCCPSYTFLLFPQGPSKEYASLRRPSLLLSHPAKTVVPCLPVFLSEPPFKRHRTVDQRTEEEQGFARTRTCLPQIPTAVGGREQAVKPEKSFLFS